MGDLWHCFSHRTPWAQARFAPEFSGRFGITHVGSVRRIHLYLARESGGQRVESRRKDGIGLTWEKGRDMGVKVE